MDAGSSKFDMEDESIPTLIVAEPEPETPTLVIAEPEADLPELAPTLLVEEPEPPVSAALSVEAVETVASPAAAAPAAPVAAAVAEVRAHKTGPVLSDSILNALEEAPPAAMAAAPAAAPASTGPAVSAARASTQPVAATTGLMGRMPMIALGLACFASLIAAIGVVVASRTIARSNAVLEEVQAHQEKMQQLDRLVDEVEALHHTQAAMVARMERSATVHPLTAGEMRAALASLQVKLNKNEESGPGGNLALIRDGQSELAERIGIVYRRLEQIDEKLASRGAAAHPATVRKVAR